MRRRRSRLTLYWLTDKEWFLGEDDCVRPASRWRSLLGTVTEGALSLASEHLFFDDGGPHVVIFPLSRVADAAVHLCNEHISVTFTCKNALRREVLTPPTSKHSVPGICRPYPNKETWVFHFPRTSEWVAESLRSLFTRHRIEDILSRREVALQGASSVVSFCARRQVPMREQRGVLYIGDAELVFEPLFPLSAHGVVTLVRRQCRHTFARWIIFEAVGLDLYTSESPAATPALSLIFRNSRERDEAAHLLAERLGVPPYRVSIQTVSEAWRNHSISSYEYLLHLNKWASRCANDVFQYPVFPWVLADYTSSSLDLSQPSTFRDLSKPIGALSPSRLALLRERAEFLREAEETAYLYSTHYSSAAIVAYYLVRPHPEFQLSLQGGTLDVPERIMESIPRLWNSVTTNSSNFRELIPQFFNEGFVALCGPPLLPLGLHADGSPVAAYVKLPPWAASSEDFVRQHRAALESDIVSASLHLWIDLVFGVAQTGEQACASDNLFHPFSYPQCDRQLSVPGLHLSSREYAREFGNVPIQLFADLHPPRARIAHTLACTAEALEACGCATTSANQQRLLRMMEELQFIEDATDTVADSADAHDEGAHGLPTHAAALTVISTTSLSCRSARFVTLGHSHADPPASPTAVLLVVGSDQRTATLFDVATGKRIRSFPDFDGLITATAFHDSHMFVFTETTSCYVLSLTSHAVAHFTAEVTPAAVLQACFASQLVVLADSNAQLSGWALQRGTSPLLFESPLSFTCEASSRVACIGSSADGDTVVAATEQLEVFVCRGGTCCECMLQQVPAPSAVLHIMPADRLTRFWVFFLEEAALYDLGGLPLRRIATTAASIMTCPQLAYQLYPLYIHMDNGALEVFQLLHSGERAVPLRCSRLRSLQLSSAGNLVAFVGTAVADCEPSLVLTMAALTAQLTG
ncbi:neutral sphingomyelinase activation associated factor-like protein [Leishmania donovani]|uniref:Neutral sphingomyelinase activation associated factor-like protein n=1 Tax=Leishmania donovani TaxID=5661 RepID=E9BGL1_LEIDO|nr:neutral sphingomyelinase activation associated factor-like protein [Leishmania donovani]CBZ34387.1 neutral sphingomyelinase activation associated factor-like protein [Leishmania donovani]